VCAQRLFKWTKVIVNVKGRRLHMKTVIPADFLKRTKN